MNARTFALLGLVSLAAACNSQDRAAERAEDKMEAAADASAAAAGPAIAALGLTEAQLLDAELVGPNNVELGDVAQVVRGAGGQVERLLVEVEDSNPDRYVHIPIAGLTTVRRGDDTDLSTTMTKAQIDALPTVNLPR